MLDAISHIQTASRLEIVAQPIIRVADFGPVAEMMKTAMVESSTTASQTAMVQLMLMAGVCMGSAYMVARTSNIGDAPPTAISAMVLTSERRPILIMSV